MLPKRNNIQNGPWRAIAWAIAIAACELHSAAAVVDPETYVAWSGGTLIPAGQLEIDSKRMSCGMTPTVLDSRLRDFGGSLQGLLIFNPSFMAGLATPVKLWIYAHECAHQTVGSSESRADCVAVQRGKREGWLTAEGLRKVCDFMRSSRGDAEHFNGPERCAEMRQCFGIRPY